MADSLIMRRCLLLLVCALAIVPTAGAITGGSYDGSAHQYVGLGSDGTTLCSGFLVSPRAWVTAGHCYPDGARIKLSFDPRGITVPSPPRINYYGTFHVDPSYCGGCKNGLPGFGVHDLGVVVLDGPVPTSDVPRYAKLPAPNLVASLPIGTQLDLVGFGYQDPRTQVRGTRYVAPSELANAGSSVSDDLVKLASSRSAGNGGICFGDSGGPDLLAGTDTAVAVNAFVTNDLCRGVAYSTRLDTPDALAFVGGFLH